MDLEVYELARHLSNQIFQISAKFPRGEMYALTDQVRRSSRSVGGQIAEAWGKRRYERHFVSKLTDADGEQLETQHWLKTALDCAYITQELCQSLLKDYARVGQMLNSMMKKAHLFCRN
jgi:four helix bundle protein